MDQGAGAGHALTPAVLALQRTSIILIAVLGSGYAGGGAGNGPGRVWYGNRLSYEAMPDALSV